MKKKKKLIFLFLLFLLFFSLIENISATRLSELGNEISSFICNIICVIWFIIAGLSAIFLIISGVKYISSENPLQRENAKRKGVFAIVGLIVVLVSPYAVNYLVTTIGILPFNCECLPSP